MDHVDCNAGGLSLFFMCTFSVAILVEEGEDISGGNERRRERKDGVAEGEGGRTTQNQMGGHDVVHSEQNEAKRVLRTAQTSGSLARPAVISQVPIATGRDTGLVALFGRVCRCTALACSRRRRQPTPAHLRSLGRGERPQAILSAVWLAGDTTMATARAAFARTEGTTTTELSYATARYSPRSV